VHPHERGRTADAAPVFGSAFNDRAVERSPYVDRVRRKIEGSGKFKTVMPGADAGALEVLAIAVGEHLSDQLAVGTEEWMRFCVPFGMIGTFTRSPAATALPGPKLAV
jgi:hypothetical protein